MKAIEKGQGLKKGEKVRVLDVIEFVMVTREELSVITPADVAREGFPGMTPAEFVEMYCKHFKVWPRFVVTRLEFIYVGDRP